MLLTAKCLTSVGWLARQWQIATPSHLREDRLNRLKFLPLKLALIYFLFVFIIVFRIAKENLSGGCFSFLYVCLVLFLSFLPVCFMVSGYLAVCDTQFGMKTELTWVFYTVTLFAENESVLPWCSVFYKMLSD